MSLNIISFKTVSKGDYVYFTDFNKEVIKCWGDKPFLVVKVDDYTATVVPGTRIAKHLLKKVSKKFSAKTEDRWDDGF